MILKYPLLFRSIAFNRWIKQYWLISIPPGWHKLVDTMCSKIMSEIKLDKPSFKDLPKIEQLKEKWWQLVCHRDNSTQQIDIIIRETCIETSKTCVECGNQEKYIISLQNKGRCNLCLLKLSTPTW